MELLEKYKEKIVIDESLLYKVFIDVLKGSIINAEYKTLEVIHRKDEINNLFIKFIEKGLDFNLFKDKQEKAAMIRLLSKMYLKKELLEVMERKIDVNKLEKAGRNLGAKSQSSVVKR